MHCITQVDSLIQNKTLIVADSPSRRILTRMCFQKNLVRVASVQHGTWQPTAAFGFSPYGASWVGVLGLRRIVLCGSFTLVHPCKSAGSPSRASYPAAITPWASSFAVLTPSLPGDGFRLIPMEPLYRHWSSNGT